MLNLYDLALKHVTFPGNTSKKLSRIEYLLHAITSVGILLCDRFLPDTRLFGGETALGYML